MTIKRIFHSVYSTSSYFITEIPNLKAYVNNPSSSNWNPEGVTIRVAELEDLKRVAKIPKFAYSARIKDKIKWGDICFVVYKNDALAHFHWVAFTEPEIPFTRASWSQIIIHLDPEEAYTYDSYTLPEFRRMEFSYETKISSELSHAEKFQSHICYVKCN